MVFVLTLETQNFWQCSPLCYVILHSHHPMHMVNRCHKETSLFLAIYHLKILLLCHQNNPSISLYIMVEFSETSIDFF